ncbi:MAG: hypothetical protein KatS3mg015_0078 [Fimbriimonadales bacterium]|nr:MAG: hypothetical protein KatS3mg015_0078 [Fimbriimonadales bacterium]
MRIRREERRLADGRRLYLYEFDEDPGDEIQARQTKFWSIAAPAWEERSAEIEDWLAPITERLLTAMPSDESALVLDAGCGRGSMRMKNRVVGIDIAPAMLDPTRRVVRGSCTVLPFRSNAFDGAVSRLVLMLVPYPLQALGEIQRTLKPGAPLAFAVWGPKERNGWRAAEETITEHLQIRPPRPDEPHIWRLSNPEEVQTFIEESGMELEVFDSVEMHYWEKHTAEEAFDLIVALSGGLSHLWQRIPEADRPAVRERAIQALADRRGEAHVYVCRKPLDR